MERQVPIHKETQDKETGRIVLFPTPSSFAKGKTQQEVNGRADLHEAGVADLRKYERSAEPDDYARRMIINIAGFAIIVALTLVGIWLAEQLVLLRKQQDCALSGRRNCAELDMQIRGR
jgi:hypothetical protein